MKLEHETDPPASEANSYEPLKTVQKTMLVLEELNRYPTRRVQELCAVTAIPASTMIRILETLCDMGYVRKLSRRTGYCLTPKITSLSAGYHGLPRVFNAIRRVADALTEQIRWPCAICTFDVNAMVVRYSTIPSSPLSHKHSTLNRRLDMLTRAHGRAWMAFVEDEERRRIWEVLIRSGLHAGPVGALEAEMADVLDSVRQTGVARRDSATEPDTTTFAVPVFVGPKLVATLGVTHFARAKSDPAMLIDTMRRASTELRNLGPEASSAEDPRPD
ncbi:DNA-binding transcriptional regulator [Pararhodobacter zhoushanensis]|uniref:DNA-binding transcriptional regulator n=1 Tax=Pararhodobacter zhoushanensis TaxID=2479545 RepID=A0ABT3GXK9_9RHOB|nr:DNA-binding transcriptional regulator [Pararhodobacter zhoushanensis]MCW1932291.1 DNA-binding transcriptional regulator [Pararhodobacter zhoushanensis]